MKSEKTIWIVEDDAGSQFVYEEILGIRYQLRMFSELGSFKSAMDQQKDPNPDLVIADLRLPDESFLSYLSGRKLKSTRRFPFLVVSSVDDIDALRLCFDEGAIDYITKPFGKAELVVKVERVLSKEFEEDGAQSISIDPTSLTVSRGELTSQLLTSKEFQILTIMEQATHHTISRNEIIDRVWGQIKVGSKTLDVHMFNLRKKMAPLAMEIVHTPPNSYRLLYNRMEE